MIAKKYIKEVPVISLKTPGIVVMTLMDELKLCHLPVVEGHECLGVVSETMIYSMTNPEKSLAEGDIKPELFTAPEGGHLYEITQQFVENKLTLLPVVDQHKHYLGSILLTDLLLAYGDFACVSEPGGIIVLDVGEKDYSLTEIAGIIESNDARILSIHTATVSDSTKLEITIKVNKMDLKPILQTFGRYNYIVSASFQEAAYEEDLKERYDSLMNYLNL